MFGCSVGDDSPGPNCYTLTTSLLKKSHNVRSNGFGSENSGVPNRSKADGQVNLLPSIISDIICSEVTILALTCTMYCVVASMYLLAPGLAC